jgi:hypothetical protein
MRVVYQILYIIAVVLFFIAVTGGSLFKPLFTSVSASALERAGIKESYITATDDKIDDMFFTMKKVELQIEKLKNFFSSDKIDESKYQRESNELLKKNIYQPLIEMFNYLFRFGLSLISFIVLLAGGICHLIYRSFDLRRRVSRLEEQVMYSRV